MQQISLIVREEQQEVGYTLRLLLGLLATEAAKTPFLGIELQLGNEAQTGVQQVSLCAVSPPTDNAQEDFNPLNKQSSSFLLNHKKEQLRS